MKRRIVSWGSLGILVAWLVISGTTRAEDAKSAPSESKETSSSTQVAAATPAVPATEATVPSSTATPAPPPAAPEAASVPPVSSAMETVLIDDELPADATADGSWAWDTSKAASGTKSHGHPAAKGMQQHQVAFANPVPIPRNGEIVTSVWLDPASPPRGVMIKFKLENGDETGVYWEGEEEVFNPGEDEEIWYYGLLPEFGTWTPLAIAAEDLGIEDTKIKSITFATYDGHVLWDRTVVRQAAATPQLPPGPEPVTEPNP